MNLYDLAHALLPVMAALPAICFPSAPSHAEHNLLVSVADNDQLENEKTSFAPMLVRQDFSLGFGAPPLFYSASAEACSLNGGKGDGGSQIPSKYGGCWIAQFPASGIDVREFGAKGNGTAFDSTAIQNALNTAKLRGGEIVWAPPTGAAYVINAGLVVASGVHLRGAGNLNWAGPIDNNESHWTNKNTWFHCKDTAAPCISIDGDGVSLDGINYWYTQPTPVNRSCGLPCIFTHAWTPTIYPYTILVNGAAGANFVHLSEINIVNASNCVDWEGPMSGVAGIYSSMEHMSLGCFNVGTRFHMIDNTLHISDIRYESWWYQGSSDLLGYIEGTGNTVGWDVEYLANPQVEGVEFTFMGTAMKFADASVTSGFGHLAFATANMQMSNISFNEVCQAMTVANKSTHVSGMLSNVILYDDTNTSSVSGQCANQPGATDRKNFALDLASDNVNLSISGVNGGYVQGLAYIGGGGSGPAHARLRIAQPTVQAYSAFQPSTPAFMTDGARSIVDLTGSSWIHASASAGAMMISRR